MFGHFRLLNYHVSSIPCCKSIKTLETHGNSVIHRSFFSDFPSLPYLLHVYPHWNKVLQVAHDNGPFKSIDDCDDYFAKLKGNITMVVLDTITSEVHIVILRKDRTWWFIPRILSGSVHPSWKWIYPTYPSYKWGELTQLLSGMNHQVMTSSFTTSRADAGDLAHDLEWLTGRSLWLLKGVQQLGDLFGIAYCHRII